MLKYIYSSVIFIVFILILSNIINFNYTQDVENIDLNNNKISKIAIDLDNINVSVSSTYDKDIKIEHTYSGQKTPNSELYVYQEGEELNINEYPYNNKNLIKKKESVKIYMPNEYEFDEIKITSKTGDVNIDSINTTNMFVYNKTGNVDIANLTTKKLTLNGEQIGVNMFNVVTEEFSSNINKVNMSVYNSIINKLSVENKETSEVNISKVIINNGFIDGQNTNVNLNVNDNENLVIETEKTISNSNLTKNEKGYEYITNEGESESKYKIKNINNISVEFSTVSEEDDE